jgi:hypothetical protein
MTWRPLAWALALPAFLLLVAVGAAFGYWAYLRLVVGFTLSDQKTTLLLPETLDVGAKVNRPLSIGMNGLIHANVPLNNDLVIPLRGTYDVDINLKAQIPVEFVIVYQGFIPVSSVASVVAVTDFNFQSVKNLRNLTFGARLPMRFHLPVTLRVPVHQTIDFDYHGPLTVHLNQDLHTHVISAIPATLRVNQTISTPVLGSVELRAQLSKDPLKLIINHADLRLNLDSLRLQRAPDPRAPKRVDSPWGSP